MGHDDNSRSDLHKMILLLYMSFTTLSTVGFGDFHPKSDNERILTIFIMVLGVAIFGYVMGSLLVIIENFKEYDKENNEGDELSKFFGMLKWYNYDVDIEIDRKRKIEIYFEYYWINNKNQSVDDEEEIAMLEQLPEDTQNTIYTEFLYKDFLKTFKSVFKFQKILPD